MTVLKKIVHLVSKVNSSIDWSNHENIDMLYKCYIIMIFDLVMRKKNNYKYRSAQLSDRNGWD